MANQSGVDGYPAHLSGCASLSDGTKITIRPIRPEDDDIVRQFLEGVSSKSGRKRLLSARSLTPQEIHHLTRIDYRHEMAFVAVTRSAGLARLHGITYSTNTVMIDLARKLGFELIDVPSDSSVLEYVKVLKTDDLTPRS